MTKESRDLLWPSMMLFASCLSVAGSIAAIGAGADKVDGKINPFFYTSMVASSIYALANITKLAKECRNSSHVEAIHMRRVEMTEITIGR